MKGIPKLGAIGAMGAPLEVIIDGNSWHQRVISCTDAAADRMKLKLLPVLPIIEDQVLAWQTEASGYETSAVL